MAHSSIARRYAVPGTAREAGQTKRKEEMQLKPILFLYKKEGYEQFESTKPDAGLSTRIAIPSNTIVTIKDLHTHRYRSGAEIVEKTHRSMRIVTRNGNSFDVSCRDSDLFDGVKEWMENGD